MNERQILIVEDNRALALALGAAVRQAGAASVIAPTAAVARRELGDGSNAIAAMVLDIGLPDINGLEFLRGLPDDLKLPTIVITAHGEIENTIAARKLGVRQFLTKPLDFPAFSNALVEVLKSPPRPDAEDSAKAGGSIARFVGDAAAMRPVFQQIANACASADPVVIRGESGTGRSLAAEIIAENSGGDAAAFHPGGEREADDLREALARGGTLILENIESLGADSQAALLKSWSPAGQPGAPRLIATAGEHLPEALEEGALRSDLFYRLNVLPIPLPPLRQRLEDLPALVAHFIAELAPGRGASASRAALDRLQRHDWPGNLRELRNAVAHALTAGSGSGDVLEDSAFPPSIGTPPHRQSRLHDPGNLEAAFDAWLDARFDASADGDPVYRDLANEAEKVLISRLLLRYEGKISRLAEAMQANRTTLRKRLRGE